MNNNLTVPSSCRQPAPLGSDPAPGGPGRRYPNMACEECGKTCERVRHHQRWCLNCRPAMQRRGMTAYMKERYARDPALRESQVAWRRANPERYRATQAKHHKRPCPACGKVRWVSHVSGEAKDKVLCRACCGLAQRQLLWFHCYWCGGAFMRHDITPALRHWCRECHGIMQRVAPLLNITRERVRQLVNKEYARLNQDGHWATRAEALASVMTARRGS